MGNLKYTVIRSDKQYQEYCNILEKLLTQTKADISDEIDLLTLLIENWDEVKYKGNGLDPIELIKGLMEENNLQQKDLCLILEKSKATVSKLLNYQKGISKDNIRKLSEHFNISQEALNRPYKLRSEKRTTRIAANRNKKSGKPVKSK